jgi:flavin-dependent dehydrogenase
MVFPFPVVRVMPESLTVHEAAVIGGGPAGAAVSILLARAGRSVILLEKEQAAHDKVCGEFISWEAAYYLDILGIDLKALGAPRIHHLRLINGKTALETKLPFPAWSLSRHALDEALLTKAAETGVIVKRGSNVTGLSWQENRWMMDIARQVSMQAKAVFLASGKHEVRGWKREKHQKHDLIGFKIHFRLSPLQRQQLHEYVEIVFFNGGYAGLELVENGHANLCFLVRKDIYARGGKNWPGLLSWLEDKAPHLAMRLCDATPLWQRPLTAYSIPYGYIYKTEGGQPNLFRLGDQMAVIPSFAGDGVSMALHSSFIAASSYLSGTGAAAYHRLATRDLGRPVRNAQRIADLTSHRAGRKAAFLMMQGLPGLLSNALHGTRLVNV